MQKKEYFEKLKDPRWQKKRLEILERDKWTCRYCGEKERKLHVHHLFYIPKTEPWEIHNGFLITLCDKCHGSLPCDDEYKKCDDCPSFKDDCNGAGNRVNEINNAIGWLLDAIWSGDNQKHDLGACIQYLQNEK